VAVSRAWLAPRFALVGRSPNLDRIGEMLFGFGGVKKKMEALELFQTSQIRNSL